MWGRAAPLHQRTTAFLSHKHIRHKITPMHLWIFNFTINSLLEFDFASWWFNLKLFHQWYVVYRRYAIFNDML